MEVWVHNEKSGEQASPSPLLPLRQSLAALKFCGFPLKFSDDYGLVLHNKRWFGVVIFFQGSLLCLLKLLLATIDSKTRSTLFLIFYSYSQLPL